MGMLIVLFSFWFFALLTYGIDVKLDKSIAKAISQKMPTGTFAILFSNGKAIVPVNNLIFDNGKVE